MPSYASQLAAAAAGAAKRRRRQTRERALSILPGAISYWVMASAGASLAAGRLFQDRAGTKPVTQLGQEVRRAVSDSGGVFLATLSDTAQGPVIRRNSIGQIVLDFTGSPERHLTSALYGASAWGASKMLAAFAGRFTDVNTADTTGDRLFTMGPTGNTAGAFRMNVPNPTSGVVSLQRINVTNVVLQHNLNVGTRGVRPRLAIVASTEYRGAAGSDAYLRVNDLAPVSATGAGGAGVADTGANLCYMAIGQHSSTASGPRVELASGLMCVLSSGQSFSPQLYEDLTQWINDEALVMGDA